MSNLVLNEEKMFADITDGIAIVINSETGIYYGMNTLGSAVLENIINGASLENILKALKAMPNVPADMETKLNAFVDELKSKELVIEGGEGSAEANIPAEAVADGFDLTVDEYSDAQELLLADPIHEVKEDTGWTPEKDSIGYTKEETKEREKKVK